MNPSFSYMSAQALLAGFRAKLFSPVEVVRESLARAEQLQCSLNCFTALSADLALDAAHAAERAMMSAAAPERLSGLPLSVKDLIAVQGLPLEFGSRTMTGNVAALDAPASRRVKAAGASIIGKSATSEFGCKAVGDSPAHGITRNPWNTDKTPGGSSCGAAASVAAGITPFALGTDGGGSLRIPAALTGLFGIKAQFGRVPVFPVSATPTLAHVGPLARTVRDAALLLEVMAGEDHRDPFAVAGAVPAFLDACDLPVRGMRIGWSPTLGYGTVDPEVLALTTQAVRTFETLGCEVVELPRVFDEDPIELWLSEFYAGVGTRLKGALTEQRELLDPAVAAVLSDALAQTSEAYYRKVFRRYELREKIRALFEGIDLLITPTLPVAAFDVGHDVPPALTGRNLVSWVYYTYPFNLTGQPAASVPAGFTAAGLPVGLQIVSRINSEIDIFRAAAAYEEARPWAHHRPPAFGGTPRA